MIFSRTCWTKIGSFSSFQRKGTGVKNGASVSIRIFSRGIFCAVFWISGAFLKVVIHEKLIIAFFEISKHLFANSKFSEKQ
tara:strand:- start:21 stop:263 length:243 start_codon:yes stop_codon:yes gene_type:complete